MINERYNEKYGIKGWGIYLPLQTISNEEYIKYRNQYKEEKDKIDFKKITEGLGVIERRKAHPSEDVITMAHEASINAFKRAGVKPADIGSVYFATETHIDEVVAATELIESLGLKSNVELINLTFTCQAGTSGIISAIREANYNNKCILVVASDTAQANIGDALEYTVGDGAAAFIIGENPVAVIKHVGNYTSNTKDFWRKPGEKAPSHMGEETVKSYKKHVVESLKNMLKECKETIHDFNKIGMHTPFPKMMEWSARADKEPVIKDNPLEELLKKGTFFEKTRIARETGSVIGNPYPVTVLITLANMLEQSRQDEKLLIISYGSGATAMSLFIETREGLQEVVKSEKTVEEFLRVKEYISPETVLDWMKFRAEGMPQFRNIEYKSEMKRRGCKTVERNNISKGEVVSTSKSLDGIFRKAMIKTPNGIVESLIAGCDLQPGTKVKPALARIEELGKNGPPFYKFIHKEDN